MRYSVVVPVHNEEDSVRPLYDRILGVMARLDGGHETIFVDDASTDRSLDRLKEIPGQGFGLTVLRLGARQGMATALQTGFDAAQGQILITLDGDLQNDPEDIPKLLAKLDEGYDVVCGWRKDRKDPLSKKIASRLANGARKILTREKIHDVGCTLRVFRREVAQKIHLSGGLHRFFTTFAAREGFRITELEVNHHPRRHGRSKFGTWGRLAQGVADFVRIQRKK